MAYLCLRFLPLVVATAVLGTLRSSNAFMSCVCTLPESRNACQRLASTRHHGSQCNVSKAVRHPMPSPRKRMTALSAFEMYVFFDLSRSRTENSQLQIWRRNSRFQQMFSGRNMSASTPATVVWSSRPSNQWRVHILAPYFDAKKR